MSRSRRKTSITGIALGTSEKWDKRQANRSFRRAVARALDSGTEPPTSLNAVSDTWSMAKDGKRYFDVLKHPDLMRK